MLSDKLFLLFSDEVFDLVEDNGPAMLYFEPVFIVSGMIDFPYYFRGERKNISGKVDVQTQLMALEMFLFRIYHEAVITDV